MTAREVGLDLGSVRGECVHPIPTTSATPLATSRNVATTSPLSELAGADSTLPNPASVLEQRKDLIQATQPIVIITESGREMMAGMLTAATESAQGLLLTVAEVVGMGCTHSPRTEPKSKPTSLAVILYALEAKLNAILDKLTHIIGGKSECDVELLKPILEEIHTILVAVFEEVKGLIGLSIEVILTFEGAVLSIEKVTSILVAVLVLLFKIIALICGVLNAAGLKVVAALLASISAVVANILGVIFHVLVDLLACLRPHLDDIIKILIKLEFEAVLKVLQVHQ